tara:strand:- start:6580 stop:7773 length:1194 start_codon:yes stop_codon:yes gene_type:complete
MLQNSELKNDNVRLGLGSSSQVWNHYKTASFERRSLTLGKKWADHDRLYQDDGGYTTVNCQTDGEYSDYICAVMGNIMLIDTTGVDRREMGGRVASVLFVGDDENIIMPFDTYAYILDPGNEVDEITVEHDDWTLTCGEGCLYSSNLWTERDWHITPSDTNIFVFNQRWMIEQNIFYSASESQLKISERVRPNQLDTFTTQLLLLCKFVVLVFLATYKAQPPMIGRVLVGLLLAGTVFEQIVLLNTDSLVYLIVWLSWAGIFIVDWFFNSNIIPNGSSLGIVVMLHSCFPQLESWELLFMAYTVFSIVTINDVVTTSARVWECIALGYQGVCWKDYINFTLAGSYIFSLVGMHEAVVEDTAAEVKHMLGYSIDHLFTLIYWSVVCAISIQWTVKSVG